jgi:hypothetical protein
MKRWIRLMAIIVASLLAIGSIAAVWLWRTTRYVPEFYEAVVQASPAVPVAGTPNSWTTRSTRG